MNSNTLMYWPRSWLDQLLMRRAPQEDAYSPSALAGALAAYIAIDLLQALSGSAWRVAWVISLTDLLVMALFTWTVLQVSGRSARLVQTLTALAGTGVLLGLVAVPLVWQAARAHRAEGPGPMLVLAWLVVLVWTVAVQAHIYRHALSTRFGYGLMLAGLHTAIAIVTLEWFFPRVTVAAG